ncbi:NAD(P)-binding protein [Aulographum hederae CBS 113979]|uniref:NAD(P)-binding protein n=1 Tax=Aulographum hederae CBS 113979 TaxID=1176131 RepID=A0A6G1HGC4_9PEZI|nr:NAD(P)-binding protein [Aulographum hederae CBS 113979]
MSSILLTGASGNLGAALLDQLLTATPSTTKINAVLRSLAKTGAHLQSRYGSDISSGRLTLTEIPDMTVPGAFDASLRGVDAIIHAATPLPGSDLSPEAVEAIVGATYAINDNMLSAAAKSGCVKRVIITGSIVSVLQLPDDMTSGKTYSDADFNPITREQAPTSGASLYSYSKVSSEQRCWAWMEERKGEVGFDLVFLLAPSIMGRSLEAGFKPSKTLLGGVSGVYRELFDRETVGFMFPYFMDVDDVAAIHIKALDSSKVPGNERYLFFDGVVSSNEAANKIREAYPQLRDRVPEGGEGKGLPPTLAQFDISKAEKVFGNQWKGWWKTVDASVKDILEYE